MMARTSYHRHQILASIALATAVIAFIFLVVDSGTSDNSGLLLSLRGIENTIQYDADGRQLQATTTVIDPKTIEVVNRSPDFIAQVQELATTVLPEQNLVQNQQQPQQKQYDPKYIYSIKCTIVDNLPTGWCMDEATQTPRYLGEDILGTTANTNNNNEVPPIVGTTYDLTRYTHAGFQKCLSNRNIVFIGESRTRYQYMSLVHYLKSEKFLKCNDRTTNPDEDCFIITAPARGGMTHGKEWNGWFKSTTAVLSGEEGRGSTTDTTQESLCDCYRSDIRRDEHGRAIGGGPEACYEHRYTKRISPYGEMNIVFLWNANDKIGINEDFPPFASFSITDDDDAETRCVPGECGRAVHLEGVNTDAFEGTLIETMEHILPLLNATHAFVNPGWEFDYDPSCELEEYIKKQQEKGQFEEQLKVAYISNPPDKFRGHRYNEVDPRNMKCNIDYLDRTTMAKDVPNEWYFDKMHVYSLLNEEFNHRLVEMICPIE